MRAKLSFMGAPYREVHDDGRKLEPDPQARRRVRLAGLTTAALGVGIGATAPMLGPLAAAFGGGLALLGLALFREAPKDPLKACCPACAQEIAEIDATMSIVRCASCGEYARARNGMLLSLPDDFIADVPSFAIPIGRAALPLPRICAECGASNAHNSVRIDVKVPGAPLLPETWHRYADIPHCDAHTQGATSELAAVRVRSHALWLAAMKSPTDMPFDGPPERRGDEAFDGF